MTWFCILVASHVPLDVNSCDWLSLEMALDGMDFVWSYAELEEQKP